MKNKKMILYAVLLALVVAGYMYAKKHKKAQTQEV